jgi:hypothetical protein
MLAWEFESLRARQPPMQFRTEKPEITAPGYTGMRKGIDGLAMLVQEALMDGNCASANKRHRAGFTSVKS